MDSFMDKLAQKLNANEMIKANTQAEAAAKRSMDAEAFEKFKNELTAMLDEKLEQLKTVTLEVEETEATEDKTAEQIAAIEKTVSEKMGQVSEDIHKECVKVYRNVQASTAEELEKQIVALDAKLKKQKGRLGVLTFFSVLTCLAALAGVAFQVLVYFHIL